MKKGLIIGIIAVLIIAGFFYLYLMSKDCIEDGEKALEGIDCCNGVIDGASEEEYLEFYKGQGWITEEELLDQGGLFSIPGSPEGYFTPPDASYIICSDCDNNNCEEWEHKYNCPEDCE